MGCLLIVLTGFAPRLAAVLYWIFRPERWDKAFDGSWVWPLISCALRTITTSSGPRRPGGAILRLPVAGIAGFLDVGSTARSAARRNG
jgi:hypothetical protein